MHPSVVQKAARRAGIANRATSLALRHSLATHLIQNASHILTVQTPLGHAEVTTAVIYTHVAAVGSQGVRSPLDQLQGDTHP